MKTPQTYSVNAFKIGTRYVTTVRARINKQELNIIVDSGAQRTIAHPEKVKVTEEQVKQNETVNIRSGLSADIVTARVATLPITFKDGTTIQHDIVLTDTLQEDVLLGADILKKYKAKVQFHEDPEKESITLSIPAKGDTQSTVSVNTVKLMGVPPTPDTETDKRKEETPYRPPMIKLITTEEVLIKPWSTYVIATMAQGGKVEKGLLAVDAYIPDENPDKWIKRAKDMHVHPTILDLGADDMKRLPVTITNTTNSPIRIMEGELIASGERIVEFLWVKKVITTSEKLPKRSEFQIDVRHIKNKSSVQWLGNVLSNNKDAFAFEGEPLGHTDLAKHSIETTTDTPVNRQQHRQTYEQWTASQKEVETLLRQGIVEYCDSKYNSPLVLVMKPNGEWRLCIDYRALNEVTVDAPFPMPILEEALAMIAGMKIFSTIDLKQGYYQILVEPADKHKTAFTVYGMGTFQWVRMPFGLVNAPFTFVRVIKKALKDVFQIRDQTGVLKSVIFDYMDDLLVASVDEQYHKQHLEMAFKALIEAKLKIHPGKCSWLKKQIKFLGHLVGENGTKMDPSRIEAVLKWKKPTSYKEVQMFLGFVNYCRKFVPNLGKTVAPLYPLSVSKQSFIWKDIHEKAFTDTKECFKTSHVLANPVFNEANRPFTLSIDASDQGIGAELKQKQGDGQYRPIGFFSKSWTLAQTAYPPSQKEAVAMFEAVREFQFYLHNRKDVTVVTDCSALTNAFDKNRINGRMIRNMALFIQGVMPNLKWIPGKENTIADYLSRSLAVDPVESHIAELCSPYGASDVAINRVTDMSPEQMLGQNVKDIYEILKKTQKEDENLQLIANFLETRKLPSNRKGKEAIFARAFDYEKGEDGLYRYKNRIYVPPPMRLTVLAQAHDAPLSGHGGRDRTMAHLKMFTWPNMARDVNRYISSCTVCVERSPKPHPKPTLSANIPRPFQPMTELAIDCLTGFPESKGGYKHALVVLDRMSRWVEIYLLKDLTADSIVEALTFNHIVRHGCPIHILADRATNQTAGVMEQAMKMMGIKLTFSVPHAHNTNGAVERAIQTLKHFVSPYLNEKQTNWDQALMVAAFAYNSAPTRISGFSPFQILYGRDPILPVIAKLEAAINQGMTYLEQEKAVEAATKHVEKETAKAIRAMFKGIWRRAFDKELEYRSEVPIRKGPLTSGASSMPTGVPMTNTLTRTMGSTYAFPGSFNFQQSMTQWDNTQIPVAFSQHQPDTSHRQHRWAIPDLPEHLRSQGPQEQTTGVNSQQEQKQLAQEQSKEPNKSPNDGTETEKETGRNYGPITRFAVGTHVYVYKPKPEAGRHHKVEPQYYGPCTVIKVVSDSTRLLRLPTGQESVEAVANLRGYEPQSVRDEIASPQKRKREGRGPNTSFKMVIKDTGPQQKQTRAVYRAPAQKTSTSELGQFEIERITDMKTIAGKKLYLVEWKNARAAPSWESENRFTDWERFHIVRYLNRIRRQTKTYDETETEPIKKNPKQTNS